MPRFETEVALQAGPEQADAAAARAVAELGWTIAESGPGRMLAKEGWKASGSTWPVSIEAHAEADGEGSVVKVRGKVGGLGPIQSRHLKKQVTRFAELLVSAAVVDPADRHQHAHQAASVTIATSIGRMKPKVRDSLLANLREDETVRVVIGGSSGQVMAGTDSRVFVLKPGFVAGASFGVETTSWSYRQVTGIQVHQGMKTGAVIIQAPGQSGVSASYWKESDSDPFKAPNAIPVGGDWTAIRRGVAVLQDLIDHAQGAVHPPLTSPAPNSTPSMAAEIKELAELHAAGALTEEEFAARRPD